jgi:hypothetical protein
MSSKVLSLTPGFSRVTQELSGWNCFSSFLSIEKSLKRFLLTERCVITALKRGVNEIRR